VIFTFSPPDKPWSTNEDRTLNKYTRADRIATWKGVTMVTYGSWCVREKHKRAREPSLVRVHIPFTLNRRRDPHNYCGTVVKAIIDGLVIAGAWKDDTPKYVEHLSPVLYKGDEVKVELFPMKPVRLPCEHGNYDWCNCFATGGGPTVIEWT
jgi:hypothetical protein